MRNEGKTERFIQSGVAVAVFLAGLLVLNGSWSVIFYVLSGVIIAFAIVGFCPLYAALGINSHESGKAAGTMGNGK